MRHLRVVKRVIGTGALVAVAFIGGYGHRAFTGGESAAVASPLAPATMPAPAMPTLPQLQLPGTAVHELTAEGSGRPYQVWVSVPASYEDSDRSYPVVFVTDAAYSFPLVRSIRNLRGRDGRNIEDFILVGLPPQTGLSSRESRNRDLTPTDPLLNPSRNRRVYSTAHFGEAAAYRDYIERQVFPLIQQSYRADMSRKVFAGHSYGGLFGSYVLLTRPAMFQHYILGSPSLWFDRHSIDRFEQEYARTHWDLDAKVMMYIGALETPGSSPRNLRDADMVGHMRRFERTLEARGYPRLSIDSQVIQDEDHLSVFPATISRGLLWALPGEGPYTNG